MNEWKLTGDDLRWQDITTEKKQVFNDVILLVDDGGKPKVLIGCWVSRGVMEGLVWRDTDLIITPEGLEWRDTDLMITPNDLDLLADRYWDSCQADRLFTKKQNAYMRKIDPSCLFSGTPTHWMPITEPPRMEESDKKVDKK